VGGEREMHINPGEILRDVATHQHAVPADTHHRTIDGHDRRCRTRRGRTLHILHRMGAVVLRTDTEPHLPVIVVGVDRPALNRRVRSLRTTRQALDLPRMIRDDLRQLPHIPIAHTFSTLATDSTTWSLSG